MVPIREVCVAEILSLHPLARRKRSSHSDLDFGLSRLGSMEPHLICLSQRLTLVTHDIIHRSCITRT